MSRFDEESSGHDLMSKIYKDYEKKGGFDNLPGKGKPIPKEALSGDVLNSVLKNANYVPDWLAKQHEVRDHLIQLQDYIDLGIMEDKEIEKRIKDINKEIKKFNKVCPMMLQKPLVSKETIKQDKIRWM